MKLAFVFDDSLDRPDGVQQYILTVGAWLCRQGHEVHYIVGQTERRDMPHVHSISRNVRVGFNGNRLSIPLPANRRAIRELLVREQFDVLHVQLPCSPWMAGRVVAAAPASTRVVGTFHILPFSRWERAAARMLYMATRRVLGRLDAVCSVSAAAQAYARSGFGLESVVIPNAVDTGFFASGRGGSPKEDKEDSASAVHPPIAQDHPVEIAYRSTTPPVRKIVFLGRLVERKGCQYLLQALARLAKRGALANTRVTICGDGPLRPALEAFTRQHGLQPIVTFAGHITETWKRDYLAGADIAVFPSLSGESFGIVLIEAMAAGAGVVLGGDNPGYRSVLGQRPELLIDPRDTAAFAGRLELLLRDDALRRKLHAWQDHTVQQYDVANVGRQLMSLYDCQ